MRLTAVVVVALWQWFVKRGEPGWKAIVPIYNYIVLMEKAGRPAWWVLLLFVPVANIVVLFLMWQDIAEGFGHGTGFAVGLLLLPFIFVLIRGFAVA